MACLHAAKFTTPFPQGDVCPGLLASVDASLLFIGLGCFCTLFPCRPGFGWGVSRSLLPLFPALRLSAWRSRSGADYGCEPVL